MYCKLSIILQHPLKATQAAPVFMSLPSVHVTNTWLYHSLDHLAYNINSWLVLLAAPGVWYFGSTSSPGDFLFFPLLVQMLWQKIYMVEDHHEVLVLLWVEEMLSNAVELIEQWFLSVTAWCGQCSVFHFNLLQLWSLTLLDLWSYNELESCIASQWTLKGLHWSYWSEFFVSCACAYFLSLGHITGLRVVVLMGPLTLDLMIFLFSCCHL